MLQGAREVPEPDLGGGLNTYPNFFALQPNQTPNSMNVKFAVGGAMEKRLGSSTINATVLVTSAATGFTTDSGGTLSTGLQGYWKLDEQAGTRFDAFSTNNLTPNGGISFAAGILGNAAALIASSTQYLAISNNATLNTGDVNFTAAAWVYMASVGVLQVITGKGDNAPGRNEWHLRINAANSAQFVIHQSDDQSQNVSATSFGAIGTNTWYFVCGWHDSAANTINIQVNNAGINSANKTLTISALSGPFSIGAFGTVSPLGGRIDEVGFWKKVLSAQERSDLYNSGNADTYNAGRSSSGFAAFDFGAGFASGVPLRWLVFAAGTGVYASSNRGMTFVVVATDRGSDFQEFEVSKNLLIMASNTGNKVLYWAGSVGTFASALAPASAPPVKHALDFAGFLLLMNDSSGSRTITYADNTKLLTDPWTSTFAIPTTYDDEITGGVILYKSAYVTTKHKVFRVSSVGGNPDFAVQEVKNWGAVPRTIKRVTFPYIQMNNFRVPLGEVMISLGYDKKIRIFDGSEDRIISDSVEQNNGLSPVFLNGINTDQMHKCHAEVDTLEQVYKLWVVMNPSTETTHCLCLNLRTWAWYAYDNQGFNACVMAESGTYRNLFGVKRAGDVHWIDTSNLDNTAAITDYYQSPFFYGRTPKMVSRSQNITFYFSVTSSGTLQYQDRTDWTKNFSESRDFISFADTANRIQVVKTVDVPMTQNVYQFMISSSSSKAQPWQCNRIDVRAQDLGVGEGGV